MRRSNHIVQVTQPSQHTGKSLNAPYFMSDSVSHFNHDKHEQIKIFKLEKVNYYARPCNGSFRCTPIWKRRCCRWHRRKLKTMPPTRSCMRQLRNSNPKRWEMQQNLDTRKSSPVQKPNLIVDTGEGFWGDGHEKADLSRVPRSLFTFVSKVGTEDTAGLVRSATTSNIQFPNVSRCMAGRTRDWHFRFTVMLRVGFLSSSSSSTAVDSW